MPLAIAVTEAEQKHVVGVLSTVLPYPHTHTPTHPIHRSDIVDGQSDKCHLPGPPTSTTWDGQGHRDNFPLLHTSTCSFDKEGKRILQSAKLGVFPDEPFIPLPKQFHCCVCTMSA